MFDTPAERLYPIIDADVCRERGLDPGALALACLHGGARVLQVRVKQGSSARFLDLATQVVETAGAVPAVELSTRIVREGGRVAILGIAGQGQELVLPADRIPLRDLSLLGSVGYTTAAWAHMVALLRERLVDLDPIVTHRFPLEAFEDAFALMDERRGVVARIVLEHAR